MSALRAGRFALLVVVVPVLLAAGGAWLLFGRLREGALRTERATALAALDGAANAFDAALAASPATLLRFPLPPRAAGGPTTVAEAQGLALADHDPAGALAYFEHAQRASGTLSPLGALARGRLLLAAGDRAEAAAVLEPLRTVEEGLGGVPIGVLAELVLARADARCADVLRARLGRDEPCLPAAAVAPVLDALDQVDPRRPRDRPLARLELAAREWLHDPDPDGDVVRGPGGSVRLRRGDDVVVVDAEAVAAASRAAVAAVHAAFPQVDVGPQPDAGALASRTLPALAAPWTAHWRGAAASTWIARAGALLLAAAAVALFSGQLALSRLVRREVELARRQRDFVDVVSHELRTPLAAMSLRAEMLAQGDVPPARLADYLRALHLDVRRLAAQVQRVLEFARLDRGARPEMVPTALRAVLADAVRQALPALRLASQTLVLDVPRTLPVLAVDRDALARAVRNLLENAARHAPAGTEVELRAAVTGGEVSLEVGDRGPGVPQSERDVVFSPFGRGAASRDVPGSGLGLALVERAARLHGGSAEVTDRPGGGALFRIRLPLRSAPRLVS